MNYDQLKTFAVVAQLHSFTQAGEVLRITQSTVTTRIKGLEQFLGVILFDRSNRDIRFSDKGLELLPLLTQQLSMYEKTKAVANQESQDKKPITISATHSIWESLNIAKTAELYEQMPSLRLQFDTDHSPMIIQKVLNEAVDYGMIYNLPTTHQLETVFIGQEEYVLFRHIHCDVPSFFALTDLIDYSWVFIPWGFAFTEWLEDYHLSGLKPTIEVSHGELGLRMAKELKGMIFAPASMVNRSFMADEFLPLSLNVPWAHQNVYGIFLSKQAKKITHASILELFTRKYD